jgi:hypothetical protein
MRKQSGWEPLDKDIRERYAPWTLSDKPNGGKKEGGEE